ncbi:NosL/MerB-like protein [Dioscorea alata]|uniref:NosL/MerB-like protein n=1 Tax=Dioscorea alata TaxID=55571 RepID=A0ACB7VS25_DIOAL|nr:NosL/MerB-like protein [Dioscorea alata]
MNPESLIASAGLNMGLALIVLSLFSVLKKQPSNAPVYYPRRLAAGEDIPFDRGFSINRLRPSVSWIPRSFRISEDEILRRCGLDALVVIRLFKFGIKIFTVCSVMGLLILAPVNYTGKKDSTNDVSHSMDSFSVSNVRSGSSRLWVHFACLFFVSAYVLYLLHKEYKGILDKRIQHIYNLRNQPNQFTVLVRGIPLCIEHGAYGCSVDHFFSKHHPDIYHTYQMVYDGKSIEKLLSSLQNQASSVEKKLEKLQQRVDKGQSIVSVFCSISQSNTDDILDQENKLEQLYQKIRLGQSEYFHKQKELPSAFVSFKLRQGMALVSQTQQHVHPLMWITEATPEPRDILWSNLAISYNRLVICKVGVSIAATLLTIFFALPVTAVQGIVQLEKLKKWFPPARAVQLIPGLGSIVTGYLPSVILNGFIYVVPYAMLSMASIEGFVSRSKMEMKACSMVFYFLVGNVFFLSLLSGSLLDQIGETFTHPKDFLGHLASAVSAQSDFFISYILTDGLSGFSLEILQLGFISWHFLRSHSFGRSSKEKPYLYGFPYYRVIPTISLAILIGMIYAVVAPMLLPFLIPYFFLGYVVYINQMQDVYEIIYETHGQYWPHIHQYIFMAVILMQITMIGLFGLKSKPEASILTIVLLILSLLFNEYCKVRFRPPFYHFSIQQAKEIDDLDELEGQLEAHRETAVNAYRPHWMSPVNISESSSTEPLLSSC